MGVVLGVQLGLNYPKIEKFNFFGKISRFSVR